MCDVSVHNYGQELLILASVITHWLCDIPLFPFPYNDSFHDPTYNDPILLHLSSVG